MNTKTKTAEELLYEVTKNLPDAEKLILVGVARGMELSGRLPKTG